MSQTYQPIACTLHDELEALATLRRECRITFRGIDDQTETITDVIADVFARGREEFLRLRHGTIIRLDRITHIDDKPCNETCRPN